MRSNWDSRNSVHCSENDSRLSLATDLAVSSPGQASRPWYRVMTGQEEAEANVTKVLFDPKQQHLLGPATQSHIRTSARTGSCRLPMPWTFYSHPTTTCSKQSSSTLAVSSSAVHSLQSTSKWSALPCYTKFTECVALCSGMKRSTVCRISTLM